MRRKSDTEYLLDENVYELMWKFVYTNAANYARQIIYGNVDISMFQIIRVYVSVHEWRELLKWI